MTYASGKHSLAICDRCGFRYKYTQLKKEWTGFFVCSECYEPKEPQLDPVPHVADPEAIRNPRPQVGEMHGDVVKPTGTWRSNMYLMAWDVSGLGPAKRTEHPICERRRTRMEPLAAVRPQ